jgi:hypothetical protein
MLILIIILINNLINELYIQAIKYVYFNIMVSNFDYVMYGDAYILFSSLFYKIFSYLDIIIYIFSFYKKKNFFYPNQIF